MAATASLKLSSGARGLAGNRVRRRTKGNLGKHDAGVGRVDRPAVAGVQQARRGWWVIKGGERFERLKSEHVGKPVLGPGDEGQAVAQIEAHGLATTGDRNMQFGVGVGRETAHDAMDGVCGQGVVFGRADVAEGLTRPIADQVDVVRQEACGCEQGVVAAQGMKLAGARVEQGQPRPLGAFATGDEMNFVGNPRRVLADGKGIESLGYDLRREAGDSQEDLALLVVLHDAG